MKSEQVKAYPRIFTAAEKARSVLLQHYNKTDLTHIYTVATAMVPRLKYEYWEVDGWGETYLEPAKNMVKKVWEQHYKLVENVIQPVDSSDDPVKSVFRCKRNRHMDELEKYISEPTVDDEDDSELSYWAKHSKTYPQLEVMAREYLAIPTTSTPSERVFSRCKHFIPASRNMLTSETFKISVLLDSWLRLEGQDQSF